MGEDKVRESPAEVFATVTEVNTAFHSLEDMLGTRFEAIDAKFGVLVEKFAAIEKNLAEMDARYERRFDAIDGRFGVLEKRSAAIEKNLAEMDARYEGRFDAINFKSETVLEKLNAMDARNKGKFDLLEQKFVSQEFKIEHCVTSANNKLMVMLLVIAGSVIAGLLYGG
ncbi:MAG: hypothetical protein OXH02_08405 [Gemmatimonadetes bacterium]|nr:hypothetical protein [Gemmatimonadota bacterium]